MKKKHIRSLFMLVNPTELKTLPHMDLLWLWSSMIYIQYHPSKSPVTSGDGEIPGLQPGMELRTKRSQSIVASTCNICQPKGGSPREEGHQQKTWGYSTRGHINTYKPKDQRYSWSKTAIFTMQHKNYMHGFRQQWCEIFSIQQQERALF
jgi:hypothetical protein